MNLTLSAVTVAVVSACFMTAGPVLDAEPAFSVASAESEAHVEISFLDPQPEAENTVSSQLGGFSFFVDDELIYVSNQVNSYGTATVEQYRLLKYITHTTLTEGFATAVAQDIVAVLPSNEVTSQGYCDAVLKYYDLTKAKAHYKHNLGTYPYPVLGYFNGSIVFGGQRNVKSTNLHNTAVTESGIDMFYIQSIPPVVHSVSSSLPNIQARAKDEDADGITHKVSTTLVARDPSNVSPYKTLTNVQSVSSEALTNLLVVALQTEPGSNELTSFGTLATVPWLMAEDVSVTVLSASGITVSQKVFTASGTNQAVTELGAAAIYKILGIPALTNQAVSELGALLAIASKDAVTDESADDVTSLGDLVLYTVEPYVGTTVTTISASVLSTYIKDSFASPEHNVETAGQTDIRYGADTFISRTENVSTLYVATLLYTPGLVEVTTSDVASQATLLAIAGLNKTASNLLDTSVTAGACSISPYKLLTGLLNEALTQLGASSVYIKDSIADERLNAVASYGTSSFIVDKPVIGLHTLVTGFDIQYVIKSATATVSNQADTVGVCDCWYQPPLTVEQIETLVTVGHADGLFTVEPVSGLNTVQSTNDNIQVRVKDANTSGINTAVSEGYMTIRSDKIADYLENIAQSVAFVTAEPNKLASPVHSLITDFEETNYVKDNFFAPEATNNVGYIYSAYGWDNSGTCIIDSNATDVERPFYQTEISIIKCSVGVVGNQMVGLYPKTVAPSTTYSVSVWFRQNRAGCSAPYLRTSVNNNSLGNFKYNGSTSSSTWPVNKWIRITATATTQANETGIYLSNYIGTVVGDTVWYYGYQIEQRPFVTAYIYGSRDDIVVQPFTTLEAATLAAGLYAEPTALHTINTVAVVSVYKDDVLPGNLHTVSTVNITTPYAKYDDSSIQPLHTVATEGQSDIQFGNVIQISRTEIAITALGACSLVYNPGISNVMNTVVTDTASQTIGGSNKTVSSIIHEPVTTNMTGTFQKDSTVSPLNTPVTALGAFTEEHVAPVTITLEREGGTGGTSSIVAVAGFSITPSSPITPPTKQYHTFNGYYTLASGGVKYINADGSFNGLTDSTFTSDVTLHAQWTEIVYTIVWKNYAGTTLKTDYMIYTETSTAPAGTTDTAQWDYSWPVASVPATSNQTVNETRALKYYWVYWKNYAGATLKSENLGYGSISTAPTGTADTMQYDYEWPKSQTTVVGTETINETRTTKQYTVTWYFYSGAVAKQETLNYGSTSTAPTGTTDTAQYQYDWPQASVVVYDTTNINETRTLLSYTITWYFYSGSIAKQETLTYGSTSTAPTGTADTAQWDYSWPKANTTVVGTENINETRVIKQYTITWKSYANVTLKSETLDYGSTSTAPIGTVDTSAYDYEWPVPSVLSNSTQTITETRTNKSYTLTFDGNTGGTPNPVSKSVTFDNAYGTLAAVSKTNWEFLGWYNDLSNSNLVRNGNQVYSSNANWGGTGYSLAENAFYQTSGSTTIFMSDFIDIWGNGLDTFDQYLLQADHKQATPVVAYSKYYFMVACYDKFGRWIRNEDQNLRANTATYLTAALTTGDEWVYLNDITNWYDDGQVAYNHVKGLALWHPDDPSDPYTPLIYTKRWLAVKYVDKTNNRLQLNAVYSGDTIPSGSVAQNHQSGGTYSYYGASNAVMTGDWVTRAGTSPATYNLNAIRYGTKQVKIGWLINREAGTETSYIRNVLFQNVTHPSQQTFIDSSSTVVVTANHTVHAHWNPLVTESALNTAATEGQSDIQFGNVIQISRTETAITALGDAQFFNQTVFTITLNKNGGSGGTSTITGSTGIDINPTSITPPTWTNYTFTGYWTATSGGTKYINSDGTYNNLDSNTFVGNVTLYAQWTMNNVYFDWNPTPNTIGLLGDVYINGGLDTDNASDWYQQKPANTVFKIAGLTIPVGWSYSSYSTARLVSVTVTGSGATTEVQGTGDMTSTLGRAIAITVVGNTYNVSVAQGGGTGSSASVSTYQPSTSLLNITMTRGTYTNYRFWKWTVAGANGQAVVNGDTITIPAYTTSVHPYGDLTITANWLPATTTALNTATTALGDMQYEAVAPFIITLDKQSGSGGTSSITCVNGFYLDPTSATVPTRAGYTFGGYYTSTGGAGTQRINSSGTYIALTNTTYTSATTLYAKWTLITYTLTADKNGGSGGNASNTYNITTSSTIATLLGSPTKIGYTLSGWKWTSASAGGWTNGTTYATSQNVVGKYASGTLQAQWTANEYVVGFNANGGTTPSPSSKDVTFGSTYGTLATTSKTNYTFIGWFTAAVGGTEITSATTVTTADDHTLYAHWLPTVTESLLNTGVTALGDMQYEVTMPSFDITKSDGAGVDSSGTQWVEYTQDNSNSQSFYWSCTALPGYTVNTPTITRLGTYGGSTPYISTSYVIIPAGSYGDFQVNFTTAANSFVLTLNANGGTTASNSQISVTYATSIEAFNVDMLPTRSGYVFTGYYTATSGGTLRISSTAYVALTSSTYTAAATLYAQWRPLMPTTRIGCFQGASTGYDAIWRTFNLAIPSSTYNGAQVRIVLVYRTATTGTAYRGDLQIDRIRMGNTTLDMDSGEDWRKDTVAAAATIGSYAANLMDATNAVGTTTANQYFSRAAGATGSSGTGSAVSVYGGYCLYAETTSTALGDYFWGMSPVFTYSYSTVHDIILAAEGNACGILAVYIVDATTTDFTPSLASPTPIFSTQQWVYIDSTTSEPVVDYSTSGNFGGSYVSAMAALESEYPAASLGLGDTGYVYDTSNNTYYTYEVQ